MIPKQLRSILARYRHEIESTGIPVTTMYVFGSTVTGNTHPGSDIDICVISPSFGKNRMDERILLMGLRSQASDLIEPHPYSPEDFSNRFDPLASEIKRHGLMYDGK